LTQLAIWFNTSTVIELHAAEQFAALGHPARLRVLRSLMAAGPDGVAASALARTADLASNATAFHLNRLRLAGLAHRQRVGREVRYTADFAAVQALLDYFGEICCSAADDGHCCGPVCGGNGVSVQEPHSSDSMEV
jgi:DNA-binding transcriptional ArsR family regulator